MKKQFAAFVLAIAGFATSAVASEIVRSQSVDGKMQVEAVQLTEEGFVAVRDAQAVILACREGSQWEHCQMDQDNDRMRCVWKVCRNGRWVPTHP